MILSASCGTELPDKIRELMELEWFRTNQLDIMLVLIGVCGAITCSGLFTHAPTIRRLSLFLMGASATILLIADRFAYIYRGDVSETGYWMVRICNFLVFFLTTAIVHTFNMYLTDLVQTYGEAAKVPWPLRINEIIIVLANVLIIISQFTGLYYTFDENNNYQRSNLFIIGYIIPLCVFVMQFYIILQYRKKLPKLLFISLILFTVTPVIASIAQFYFYGLSLINLTIVGLVVMLRICELVSTRRNLDRAKQREIELLRQEKQTMRTLIEQTAYALAETIDMKDNYTHGHSTRVAAYAEMIAKELGWSGEQRKNLSYIALLHDVGKIGIPAEIINKDSRLTDEEYAVIKTHPVLGFQILSKINKFPDLSIGAHYHHERYDGKGYPDGLQGKEIPEIARIIAVADAYDAMTSKRSYRDALPQQIVRAEVEKGIGTQFDPDFARIMLKLIDQDTEYKMREI